MPSKIDFCEKHKCDKHYYESHQKYDCRECKREATQAWREKNRERAREIVRKSAAKRREFIKQDKINFPEKYFKTLDKSVEFCQKHDLKKVKSTDGPMVCRQCKIEYAIEYRAKNAKYAETKLLGRLKDFNLNKEQYEKLIDYADGKCHICNQIEKRVYNGKTTALAIDHCHVSEKKGVIKVRGLLCFLCNASLGGFKDDIQLLQNAIDYLKRHNEGE